MDIWIAAENQGLFHYNGTEWKKFDLTAGIPAISDYRSIVRDLNGNIWFANNGKGILRYNGTEWKQFRVSNSGIKSDFVTELIVANDGKVWAGADEYLMLFNGSTWSSRNLDNEFEFRTWINSFYKDNQGNIWITTDRGILLNENGVVKALSQYGKKEYQSLAIDKKGIVWLSEIFEGIWRFEGATGRKFTESDHQSIPTQCWEILISEKNEKLMIGNRGSNLISINDNSFYSSVTNLNDESKIIVYPNPTNGIIFVDSEFEFSNYKLIKVDGQMVKEKAIIENQNNFLIEIDNEKDGQKLLILQLETKSGLFFSKLVFLK
jgi:ligand-binding sensor domain-containing protein